MMPSACTSAALGVRPGLPPPRSRWCETEPAKAGAMENVRENVDSRSEDPPATVRDERRGRSSDRNTTDVRALMWTQVGLSRTAAALQDAIARLVVGVHPADGTTPTTVQGAADA